MESVLNHSKDEVLRLAILMRSSWHSMIGPVRQQSRRPENVWMLCWMLKDLGWAMFFGPLAWPAALAACALQAQDALHQWDSGPVGELVHSLAALAWLIANSVWMTVQLLFEPEVHKTRTSPWYSGSIFTASPENYQRGVYLMQFIDIAALLGLLLFYVASVKGHPSVRDPTGDAIRERRESLKDQSESSASTSSPLPDHAQGLVFGVLTPEVYSKVFIAPWILKDLFWGSRSFIPAIICMIFATVLMADYLFLFMKWKNFAMLLWTTGTAVWITHDLVMHDQEVWPLLLSVLIFTVAASILGAGLITQRTRFADGMKDESRHLL